MSALDDKSQFDAFVKRQQQAKQEPVDWDQERDEWLRFLEQLYAMVETFLKEYVTSGAIELYYEPIHLLEEDIGEYDARQLTVRIGIQPIVLRPVGTMLIGTKGRVDVIGQAGRSRLLLVDKNAKRPSIKVNADRELDEVEWIWKIATSPPRVEYIDLTQDSLFRTLLEVANA